MVAGLETAVITQPAEDASPATLVQSFPTPPTKQQAGDDACVSSLHPNPASVDGLGVPAPGCPTGGGTHCSERHYFMGQAGSLVLDALSQSWTIGLLNAFPPLPFIP